VRTSRRATPSSMIRLGPRPALPTGSVQSLGIAYLLSPGRSSVNRCAIRTIYAAPLMSMDPSSVLLTDRVAVVTGGGAGIGRGIARGLTAFGANVAIWERDGPTPPPPPPPGRWAPASPPDVAPRGRGGRGTGPHDLRARTGQHPVNNAGRVFRSPLLETSENGPSMPLLPGQLEARHPVHAARGRGRWSRGERAEASLSVTSIEGVRRHRIAALRGGQGRCDQSSPKTAALELAPTASG